MSKPKMILGHFSSIVTTLTAVPGKPWLVSTDREGKIRINKILPKVLLFIPRADFAGSFCVICCHTKRGPQGKISLA